MRKALDIIAGVLFCGIVGGLLLLWFLACCGL